MDQNEYPFSIEASGDNWKQYYNSGHYMMVGNPYMATRYKTIEGANKDLDYVKSNYEDNVTVQVVLFQEAYKQYLLVYEE